MHRKHFLSLALSAVALSLFSLPTWAQVQANLAGVKFEPEVTLGGQKLQLNGTGVRIRAIFRVYVAGLYTPTKVTKNEDVLKPTPKRLHLVALRDVKGDEFGKLFTRAMEDNATREEFAKSVNNVIRMGQIFADAKQFAKGDVILVDYVPGTGTVISHKGKQLGDAFKEPEFHSLMMKIWFGPKPADEALRKALLGEQSTANTNIN
jgi:hypothetical protein